ncbi:MAG TPA: threonine synthase [Deltaproteobacteria bacterium]|nr:threonine synthase [Deltaproteobacteria bacterium]
MVFFKSTNNPKERITFEEAFLRGLAPDYGLYTVARDDIPRLHLSEINGMPGLSYAEIAYLVLRPYLEAEVPADTLEGLLHEAYREDLIPTDIENITGRSSIMWLTKGPTYSFKDYAARFFGRMLDFFLERKGLRRTVVVATSGDTGGAVADALHGLANVDNIVFFPKGSISEGQRRQMTTLGENVYAFEVNGDFDLCQALAKYLLGDRRFAEEAFGAEDHLTSANSISVGRLLPQAVYPFFAYSRVAEKGEPLIASVPSGNFGDMMGTVLAKAMGLPISTILVGVNENDEFPEFLRTGIYTIKATRNCPSSAMNVSHPSNLARLIDFYGGHMFDERDATTGGVVRPGVIGCMPDLEEMRRDLFSVSVSNEQHYRTMRDVYERFGVILDPHGAVGWRTLDIFLSSVHDQLAVVYETADPGKFPEDVEKAIGSVPALPPGMKKQADLPERTYSIGEEPERTSRGLELSPGQIDEAREKILDIFR